MLQLLQKLTSKHLIWRFQHIELCLQDTSSHDAFDTACKFEEVDVDNVSMLTVSVQGKQYSVTPHEVSQMPLQSFSALWTVCSELQ